MRYINKKKVTENLEEEFTKLIDLYTALWDVTDERTRSVFWKRIGFTIGRVSFDFELKDERGSDINYCNIYVDGGDATSRLEKLTDNLFKKIYLDVDRKVLVIYFKNGYTFSVYF